MAEIIVSVIIPVYNVEPYIAACIESVLVQSLRDIEVLCVDDRGCDASMTVVKRMAKQDPRIRILRHWKNRGLGPARNTGLKAARGRYIAFLDSDDLMPQGALEHMYKAACETGADVVAGQGQAFADRNEAWMLARRDRVQVWTQRKAVSGVVYGLADFAGSLRCFHCVAWGKLFSRNFLRQNRVLFIDSKAWHEDNGFHVKSMACFPRVTIIPELSSVRRVRENSITTFQGPGVEERRKRDLYAVMREAVRYIRWRHQPETAEKMIAQLRLTNYKPYVEKYDEEYARNCLLERLRGHICRLLGRPL